MRRYADVIQGVAQAPSQVVRLEGLVRHIVGKEASVTIDRFR